jgi:NAD(P)-dependent dehydrogenase (short-subunit alcohol dehydrogenase family)
MPTVLISGANRGLGLEFARQYAEAGWTVHACCRAPETADVLNAIGDGASGNVTVHTLDVGDVASIQSLADKLGDTPVDLLLNNAGQMEGSDIKFGSIDYDLWEQIFRANLIGPTKMAEAFVDAVAASEFKRIVTLSSGLGSLTENSIGGRLAPGGLYLYRSSKTAANMMTSSLAHDLKDRGITAIVVSPGHVRTDMGGPKARLGIEESITSVRNVIDKLTIADSGKFFFYDVSKHSW